ncbi:YfcC family protein [uncultured Endozoicomonas sp.]|uniref:YfcC family protein n=1 Tax=uncultured Endozoicomonas sp. TaxID=432652 RepID=UPI002636653E|nr:YfcC family protein [uncultured Endozoicomonas sp.]
MKAISEIKLPSAYTILFMIIAFMAAMTWIVPAGQYDMAMNETLGREVAVAGTYAPAEANPQGIMDIIEAPITGIQKTIDLGLFILFIGGYLMVITATGAIDSGIARAVVRMKGKEHLMIPALMLCFAAGGTIYGMAEETIPFYILLLPVIIAAGYDATVAVAIVLVGSGVGVLGSTINPFATVIASDASGIPFTQGMGLRLLILALSFLAGCFYVMRYAKKIRNNPELSIVADMKESNEKHFLEKGGQKAGEEEFTGRHKLILSIFGLTFAVMVWGVAYGGWWMNEMSVLFLSASILVAIIDRMSEEVFVDKFLEGAKDLLGVVLVLGIARGIGTIMDNGMISGTILNWGEGALADAPSVVFINLMYWIHVVLSFLIPSTSGLAVFSMPIIAPLADFAGVGRDLAVTAYQSASGLVNLVTPTSGVVIAALAIGRISIVRWFKFMAPLLLVLAVIAMVCLSVAAM